MSRAPRRLLIGLAVVAALFAAGWVGLRAYLNSSAARSLAASKLSEQIGLPVEVDALSVGAGSSTLSFRVVEPLSPGGPPADVLRVENATADVSLVDLITGRIRPQEVTIADATLSVRVAANNDLLTKMPNPPPGSKPAALPRVRVTNATVKVQQDGRPEFVVTGVHATADPAGGKVKLAGTVDDPNWGRWEAAGDGDLNAATGTVTIRTADGPLVMDRLRSIPYIPAATWKHVTIGGRTAAAVTFTVADNRDFTYRADLTPNGAASVAVESIDAPLALVRGRINVSGAVVELVDCHARLADGDVDVGGTLDFGASPAELSLKVAARGLDVKQLPADWRLPKDLGGKLKGTADLTLRVPDDGPIQPSGGGEAVIEGASFAGGTGEISLRLRAEGGRYRFQQMKAPAGDGRVPRWRAAARACQAPPPKKPAAPPAADDEPTTIDANLNLRDIDLAELLKRLNVEVPVALGGKVSVKVSVSIPLAQANSLTAYKATGSLTSPEFRIEGTTVRDLAADLKFDQGVLTLTSLRGSFPADGGGPAGTFRGTATAAVEPRGDLTAALELDRVPLGEVLKAVPGGVSASGPVTGRATFRGPINTLSDPATWVAAANVQSAALTVFGRSLRDVALAATVEKGVATLTDARVVAEGLPATATGTVALAAPYKFNAVVKTAGTEVANFAGLLPADLKLPQPLAGKLDFTANANGTLSPLTWAASGTASATDVRVGASEANALSFGWAVDDTRVRVSDLKAGVFGGRVTGSADVPFDPKLAGTFGVNFADMDTTAMTRNVPEFPLRLAGKASGKVAGTLPPARPGEPRQVDADVELSAPRLTVQNIPTEKLTGKLGLDGGAVTYNLEGRSLGGTFELSGRYPARRKADPGPEPKITDPRADPQPGPVPDPKEEPKPDPKADRGFLRVRGLDLARAAAALRLDGLGKLAGAVDLTLAFDNDLSGGAGRVSVRGLAWGDDRLADDLVGGLRVLNGVVELRDVSGRYAGGAMTARGRVSMRDTRRNFFVVSVERADAKRLFAPLGAVADGASGEASLLVRGRFGADTRGSGQIEVNRGSLFGLGASDLRLPFEWAGAGGGSGQLTVREASTRVGQGRVTLSATYNWGDAPRLDGKARFTEVRLRSVLGENQAGLFGASRATGRFDFGGQNVRSADDVTGTLSATLNQASVQEIPVLRTLTPYLSPRGVLAPFQTGDVKGTLSRGVFRLERLALSNEAAQLFASGTVTLAGRLDLDVVANTGQVGINTRGLRLLGLRIPAFGPIPISLLQDVSDYLSNRTVRLHVTGSTASPSVQVNTAALLSEEAVRFIISRYIPGAAGLPGVPGGYTPNP